MTKERNPYTARLTDFTFPGVTKEGYIRGYVGARLAIAKEAKLVRPYLVATSLAITLKLLVFR